jgi:hypothetical protein
LATLKKYLDFQLLEKKPKTAVYHVVSKSSGQSLGRIYWYGPWRQYIFEPESETIWSCGCMQEVMNFIQKLMLKRKR